MKHLYSPLYSVLKRQVAKTETDDPTAEFYVKEEATMGYINSNNGAGFNGATGSMGRYSYMGDKKNSGIYQHLYHKIDLSSPEMDDMPSQAAPGASMATQARAAGYQDMFRNIQAMRDAEYNKERRRGEITSEFSGARRPGNLAGNLGYWFNK